MASSALRSVFSTERLRSAWAYVNTRTKNPLSSGTDGHTLQAFNQGLSENLRALQRELWSDKGYEFSPLLPLLVPKPSGKLRLISVPTVRDRVVQRALLDYLSEGDKCGIQNEVSYGFVRERTVRKAVTRVTNLRQRFPWAYKADISSFFDSLERGVLDGLVPKTVRSAAIRELLAKACRCEIAPASLGAEKNIKKMGIRRGYGVRQGMALSPLFANLMLRDFDRSARSAQLNLVRYADDLIFLARSESECQSIAQFCDRELALLNLRLEPEKTVISAPNETAEFLGVGIVRWNHAYSARVMDKQVRKIQDRLTAMPDMQNLAREGITLSKFIQRVDGVISGYIGAYEFCDNLDEVEHKLAALKQQLIHSVLRQALGIDPTKLSVVQMAFLGIEQSDKGTIRPSVSSAATDVQPTADTVAREDEYGAAAS